MNTTLFVVIGCLIMSAFFSAAEMAYSSINVIRLKSLAEKGNKSAELVLKLLDDFDSLISSILIGNNIVNILNASLTTVLFIELFGAEKGPSLSTIITTIVILIFGEITPKSIVKLYPEKFTMITAPILRAMVIVLTPFNFLFQLWKKLLSVIIKGEKEDVITEDELITFVEETAEGGTIDEDESNMIKNVIKFTDLDAIDIMTPIIDVVTVTNCVNKEDLIKLFVECGYSRLPVKDENGNIVGIINYKDFISNVLIDNNSIESVIKPAKFIHGGKSIRELLDEFRNEQNHIAIVTHEYGGIYGIVTLEDILEELVGEIWDEEDDKVEDIIKVNNNMYELSGMTSLLKLDSELSLQIEDIEFNTVNGWVVNLLNGLPKIGDTFTFKEHKFTVLEMGKNRIEKLKVEL